MAEGDTLANALIGALVTVLTTPVLPGAPLLGGLVSGYLQGGDREDGLIVGTYAGLIALLPLFVLVFLLGNLLFFLVAVTGSGIISMLGGLGLVVVFVLFVGGLLYIVLLSTLGGWLGNYLKTEMDL